MSAVSRRAARRELQAARAFGVQRTQYRLRFESAPDIELVPMPLGPPLSVEVKTRKKLPRLIVKGLCQAQKYEPAAIAALVLSELGSAPVIVLPLKAFCAIVGIEPGRVGG